MPEQMKRPWRHLDGSPARNDKDWAKTISLSLKCSERALATSASTKLDTGSCRLSRRGQTWDLIVKAGSCGCRFRAGSTGPKSLPLPTVRRRCQTTSSSSPDRHRESAPFVTQPARHHAGCHARSGCRVMNAKIDSNVSMLSPESTPDGYIFQCLGPCSVHAI